MPFLPSLAGIKDVANSINPLNLLNSIDNAFTPQPTHPSQSHSAASASASASASTSASGSTQPSPSPPPSAEAGPGPSTQAQSMTLGHVPPGEHESNGHADGREGRAARPSLRDAHLSSSDSSDGLPRPRASGVVIARPVSVGVESRRRKSPMDQYIIVKPPPTASKNPLNLQIQLVVRPPRRDRSESNVAALRSPSLSTAERFSNFSNPSSPSTPTFELDIPRSETPTAELLENPMIPLSRQTSRKSSTSTTLSAISTASGKRIEPMFNLQVHNVVHPTTVTDAATDVKVAKFLKRNVDISGVGVIEPAEVWHNAAPFDDPPQRSSQPVSMYSLTVPISPTATREEPRSNRNSLDLTLRPDVHQGGATRKFLGKMFKKKTSQDFANANPRKSPSPSFSSLSAHEKLPSVPAPSTRPLSNAAGAGAPAADHAALGAPTFGTSPLVVTRRSSGMTSDTALGITSSVSYASLVKDPPSTRPVGYTWAVKRWAKRNTEGWAAHLVAAAAAGLDMVNGALTGEGEDGVVFEWVKQRPAVSSGLGVSRRLSIATTSRSRSRPPSTIDRHSPPTTTASLHPPKRDSVPGSPTLDARPEPVRRVSASASPISRHSPEPDASSVNHTDEESDPEDSETPWTCFIWVKKTGHRQLLGTLTPAPHHPKVIAQLKIPTRLDAVALAEVKGSRSDLAKRVKAEVALTEENLKDVVCVTAMWLVAREEFGGLGRKRRP